MTLPLRPHDGARSAGASRERATRAGRALRSGLLLGSASAFCAIVAWQLTVTGPFGSVLPQPPTLQGGLEAALLIGLAAACARLRDSRARATAWVVLGALYLRRHAVDLPLLIDAAYLETIIALGAVMARVTGSARPAAATDYLRCFVLGLCGWSVCAWTMSAGGFGTPRDLRWLTLALCIPALAARSRPLVVYALDRIDRWPISSRMLAGALAAGLLVQFARTNVVVGYDALWYGLRGEYVLSGDGSAFAALGLVSPVYYFPKLYELFLLPLSGLGDYSVIVGVTLGVLALTGLAAAELLQQLGLRDRLLRLCGVALCVTLPAIANAALEPKPDVIAGLLVMLAWSSSQRWLDGERGALAWMLGCGMLATQAKLTTIPFVGTLLVATALAALVRSRSKRRTRHLDARGTGTATTALILATVVAMLVSARTLLLTGVPTIGPDPLFRLWQLLGFSLAPPAGTLRWTYPQDWSDLPALLVDWTFRPQRLEHIVITWVGNVWLWLPLSAACLAAHPHDRTTSGTGLRWTGTSLILAGAIVALGWRYHVRGSDGNYFICALIPAVLLGTTALASRLGAERRGAIASMLLFAGFQAAVSFVSADYFAGTRAFDLELGRSVRDTRLRNRQLLEAAGAARIADRLRDQPGTPRAIGCMEFEIGMRLPARFEDLQSISYSHPEFTLDGDAVVAYMSRYDIPFLILPKRDLALSGVPAGAPSGLCVPNGWRPHSGAPVVDDERYVLYDIRPGWGAP